MEGVPSNGTNRPGLHFSAGVLRGHLLNQYLAGLWARRSEDRDRWSDEDRRLLAAMERHREFHPLWDRLQLHVGKEIVVGDVNPLLHVAMHAILAAQVEAGDPREVTTALEALQRRGFSLHRAEHVVGHALIAEIHAIFTGAEPFNDRRYRGRLRLIEAGCDDLTLWDRLARRTGRNEPCPCGSGLKFKKCCHDFVRLSLDPEEWAFLLDGGTMYCSYGYAARAADDDPVVTLQNMSAVAMVLENRLDDPEGALHCFQQMLQIAESAGTMVENVLDDITVLCLNHPQFARHGLEAAERLLREFPDDDPLAQVPTDLDRAEFLTHLGRVDEARAIFEHALAMAERDDADPELKEIVQNRWDDWKKTVEDLKGV